MKPSDRRWEQGLPHHPLSEAIFELLREADREEDYFCWKSGGDGDNGETLMYLLDEHLDTHGERCPACSRLTDAVNARLIGSPTDG